MPSTGNSIRMSERRGPSDGYAPLSHGLLILAPVFGEIVALRLFLKYGFDFRLGFTNTTDFDFIVPLPIAFLLLMMTLEIGTRCILRLNRIAVLVNVATLVGFILVTWFFDSLARLSPIWLSLAWHFLLLSIAASALCLFVSPRFFLRNPNRAMALPCLLLGLSTYLHGNYFSWAWRYAGPFTSDVLRHLLGLAGDPSTRTDFTSHMALRLDHPLLSIRIGAGCGGVDGFFFFLLVFLVFFCLHKPRLSRCQWSFAFVGGLVLIFCLNLVRIFLLFFGGIWLKETFGTTVGVAVFKGLFHVHAGWLLYSLGMANYVFLWSLWLKRRQAFAPRDPSSPGSIGIPAESFTA